MSEVTYISSNGYNFCFDMRKDAYPIPGLGLVCPRWVEDLPDKLYSWVEQRAHAGAYVSQPAEQARVPCIDTRQTWAADCDAMLFAWWNFDKGDLRPVGPSHECWS